MEAWIEFIKDYQISNLGRIKSLPRWQITGTNGYFTKEKILSPFINNSGYYCIRLRGKSYTIHSIVANSFVDNPNNYNEINHINGIKTDNRAENLQFCTRNSNVKHAYDTGLRIKRKRENATNVKLTEFQVKEIRNKYKPYSFGMKRLAKEYGVSCGCIQAIIENKSWI